MQIFADTLDVVGTGMIAYMALRVHFVVREEHKIDGKVARTMRREQRIGIIGVFYSGSLFDKCSWLDTVETRLVS